MNHGHRSETFAPELSRAPRDRLTVSDTEPPPLRGPARIISLAAITLAIFAGTLFIVVIVLGSGGSASVALIFGPIAIGATLFGVVAAILATGQPRTRSLGIVALLVLVPSIVLSLLTLVAFTS